MIAPQYELLPGENVEREVQRVARERIQNALDAIANTSEDRHEVVHACRKRCKEMRGLLRLVRDELDVTYGIENLFFREASRRLSWLRDAKAMVEATDALIAASGGSPVMSRLADKLRGRLDSIERESDRIEDGLARFAADMKQVLLRVDGWSLAGEQERPFRRGLMRTYGRARRGRLAAMEDEDAEVVHEWRKRVKYHWYHLRLLRAGWPEVVRPTIQLAKDLSTLLGDHHDLHVLEETVRREAVALELDDEALAELAAACERRQRELLDTAIAAGARLFTEKPAAVADRLHGYWTDEPNAPSQA